MIKDLHLASLDIVLALKEAYGKGAYLTYPIAFISILLGMVVTWAKGD
jgi:hypothetical protein